MISLEQHNKEMWKFHMTTFDRYGARDSQGQKNGIACPNCNSELTDSSPDMTLTSHPPQKNVHCDSCGYKGYRIA